MNFRFTNYIFFVVLSILSIFMKGQNIHIDNRINNNSPINIFFDSINTNISDQILNKKINYTELNSNYYNFKQSNYLLQKGNGLKNVSFNVKSNFLIDSLNYVWGNVSYKNGSRKNVKWNESSDYNRISPYVMADSVGGNLSLEEYNIEGGYNRKMNRFNFGLLVNYKALIESRNRDPRPKNIVSDLNFNMGLSSKIYKENILSLSILLNKYTQSNDLKFFSQLGNSETYHLSGLGMYNNMFVGSRNRAYFDGNGYGLQLSFFNANKKGIMATIGFSNLSTDKILTDLQDLVISNINEIAYNFDISYMNPDSNLFKGIRINGKLKDRKGREGIFFNETSSNYKKIDEVQKYSYESKLIKLSSLFGLTDKSKMKNISFTPSIIYSSSEEKYFDPSIKQRFENITSQIEFSFMYKWNEKSLTNFGINLGTKQNLTHEWNSSHYYSMQSIQNMMINNYQYLSSNNIFFNLNFRQDYSINQKYSIFLDANYYYANYKSGNNTQLQLSLGLFF